MVSIWGTQLCASGLGCQDGYVNFIRILHEKEASDGRENESSNYDRNRGDGL